MFEKVNPSHPDKIADRIAGAIVDLAYGKARNPRIAVEALIGHHVCSIIAETSVWIPEQAVIQAVHRIAGDVHVVFRQVPQDTALANNQARDLRCGDTAFSLPAIWRHIRGRQRRRAWRPVTIPFYRSVDVPDDLLLPREKEKGLA